MLSADCKAAGILLSSQQEARLVKGLQTVDFSVIAGTLHTACSTLTPPSAVLLLSCMVVLLTHQGPS
jgi:hypothetical protein